MDTAELRRRIAEQAERRKALSDEIKLLRYFFSFVFLRKEKLPSWNGTWVETGAFPWRVGGGKWFLRVFLLCAFCAMRLATVSTQIPFSSGALLCAAFYGLKNWNFSFETIRRTALQKKESQQGLHVQMQMLEKQRKEKKDLADKLWAWLKNTSRSFLTDFYIQFLNFFFFLKNSLFFLKIPLIFLRIFLIILKISLIFGRRNKLNGFIDHVGGEVRNWGY